MTARVVLANRRKTIMMKTTVTDRRYKGPRFTFSIIVRYAPEHYPATTAAGLSARNKRSLP